MASNFIANYRGAKSKANARKALESTNKLPERGVLQKNRQQSRTSSLPQPTDFDRVPGTFYETSLDERLNSDDSRKFTEAIRGSLFANQQDDTKPSQMMYDDRMTELMNSDVYDNYDVLNSVLDDFDAAETIADKRKVINDAWDTIKPYNWKSGPGWFLWLNGLVDYAEENGDDMSRVSHTFRVINDRVKNSLYRRV